MAGIKLPGLVAQALNTLREKSSASDTADAAASEGLSPAELLDGYKKEALQIARANAGIDGRPPTISDYYIACEQLGEQHEHRMARQGLEWNAKIYADMRGQTLDGFLIRQGEIEPDASAQQAAIRLAAQQRGVSPDKLALSDVYDAMRQVNDLRDQQPQTPQGVQSAENFFDLDQDHTVSNFYAEASRAYEDIGLQAGFGDASFVGCTFHPAGTLTRYHTEGASYRDCTFDASQEGDVVTLKNGQYENIAFTNIQGGTIEIADGAQIHGMDITGAHASLTIGHASVDALTAEGARIVTLSAASGAVISNSEFSGTTIDMASEIAGSRWQNVTFEQANLQSVDFKGTQLSNVTFRDSDLSGVSFAGAMLRQVNFTGSELSGLNLEGARLEQVSVNGVPVKSPEHLALTPDVIAAGKGLVDSWATPARSAEETARELLAKQERQRESGGWERKLDPKEG